LGGGPCLKPVNRGVQEVWPSMGPRAVRWRGKRRWGAKISDDVQFHDQKKSLTRKNTRKGAGALKGDNADGWDIAEEHCPPPKKKQTPILVNSDGWDNKEKRPRNRKEQTRKRRGARLTERVAAAAGGFTAQEKEIWGESPTGDKENGHPYAK